MKNFIYAQVCGLENGGIEIFCRLCDEPIAAGGCNCCDENEVLLIDLVAAARDHICKELCS